MNAPKSVEARCLFSGYPSNKDTYQRVYLGDAQLVFDDQYIEPRQKIEVFCHKSRQYELFVNSTETHLEEFISECKHGQFDHKKEEFPTCVERRCSVSVSSEVCFWMDDREHCKANNFSIPSRSSVHMRCRDGYKLSRSEDGRSVEVDGDALIMCNKGAYDESYRCISEPCAVPEVKHSKLISKDASSYEHGENITFACDTGFHFYQNISTKINAFETTCNLVQWTDDIPSGCKPDGCKLDLLEGSKYYSADKTVEIANATLIKHTTSIRMQCRGMFDLFNENNNIFRDKEYMPAVICYQGKWRNQHFCKKRCGTLNITNGKLIKDGRNVTEGETIAHGESVYVKNNNKKADSDLPADSAMKCHDGEWQNFVGVSSSSSTPATTTEIITTIAIDSTTISEADKQSRGKDVLPEKKHIQNTRNKGCTLPDDQRYTYTDFDDNNKDPGSFISDGTTLTVGCTTLDLYDFYTSSYDYDYNSTSTITCMKNTLSQLELDCPEVTPNTCKELQHGSVNEKNGYFIVSCDEGYSLDLIVPERPQCTCENGQLKSVFGGQAPACIPDKCVIPYEFDVRLSVTDRRRVSLSGGSVVEVGDFVYFNCSKAGESKYEPLNRRFKCVNGLWKEAERDRNWKLGYNGEFPSCRAAICEPNCTNGGVCFKDDNCRCKHLTEGKRCEKFICDDTCFGNGGECTGPGRCSCPAERFGLNCEQKGCILPKNAANYTGQRIASPGTTLNNFACDRGYVLSSQNGMMCRDGGSWSQIVTCIKGCTLPNHAANNKDRETTFSPGQTLNNFACQPGYVLSSENGMTCQRGGSWSEIVTCIKGCTLPNHAANHKDRGTTFSPGEILNNFACRPGYVLSSENGMTCRHGGSWSEIVTCTKGCTLPNHAANHKDRETTFSPGQTLNNFACQPGYVLSSEKGMNVTGGSWSEIVTCIKGCTLPNHAANHKDRGTTFSPGEILNNFACRPGYVLSSENGMTCRHGGSWSEIVTCTKGCTLPNHAANNKDRGKTFSHGETLNNFACQPGYVLSSEKGMTCQRGGSWSEIVTCIKGCTLPNQVTDSKDSRTIFSPGETFYSITCQPGYVLSSQNGMKCQHDGSWSEILTCSKVQQMECWFDAGHKWYPKWNEIEYYCGHKQHSVKECQDSCLNQKKIPLKSVFHNPYHGSCCCLAVSAKSDFVAKRNQWNSLVYILSCK
ncbi:sushi, von Willebrand factor type A, EGF and pentraxin domain-containing protein 1-like [Mercenaria mercenaria]|uniref:sushi, von Willebrand factor type A, EGF and pentraxin domain-containing protein 1-like n=1 Tax=Mercenaria mercenaria TaxID=6596 RepID=UPI00234F0181|nr:sushi, von Willebrand factor type A, EGF and pentraxin domain-containing protein 1-like [Mercenaria mercenaria]